MQLIESGALPLRSGIKRIIDEAIAEKLKLAVCSTSNEKSVRLIVELLLGTERAGKFEAILFLWFRFVIIALYTPCCQPFYFSSLRPRCL